MSDFYTRLAETAARLISARGAVFEIRRGAPAAVSDPEKPWEQVPVEPMVDTIRAVIVSDLRSLGFARESIVVGDAGMIVSVDPTKPGPTTADEIVVSAGEVRRVHDMNTIRPAGGDVVYLLQLR